MWEEILLTKATAVLFYRSIFMFYGWQKQDASAKQVMICSRLPLTDVLLPEASEPDRAFCLPGDYLPPASRVCLLILDRHHGCCSFTPLLLGQIIFHITVIWCFYCECRCAPEQLSRCTSKNNAFIYLGSWSTRQWQQFCADRSRTLCTVIFS